MKIIVCFRHLKCICRKWRRGMDYSWHVQHLLREFGAASLLIRVRLRGGKRMERRPSNMNLTSPTVLDQAYWNLRRGFDRVALIESKLADLSAAAKAFGEFWSFIKAKHGTYQARRETGC